MTPQYNDVTCDLGCYRFYVVYKMGLALFIYHGLMALFLNGVRSDEDPRSIIQDGFWPAKLVLMGACYAGTMWIPRQILDLLFYPSVALAIVFMAAQALIMVDVTYSITGFCLDNGGALMGVLIIISLGLYGLIGYGTYALWGLFKDDTERLVIMISAVLTILLSVCSVLPIVRKGNDRSGLFQASIIGTLSLAIVGSAIVFSPEHQIQATVGSDKILRVMTIITHVLTGVFAFIAIVASSYIGSSGKGEAHAYNYSGFHFIFMIASMYLIANYTNWRQPISEGGTLTFHDSSLAFWAKIGIAGCINLFYGWTLVAPIMLSDREFEF